MGADGAHGIHRRILITGVMNEASRFVLYHHRADSSVLVNFVFNFLCAHRSMFFSLVVVVPIVGTDLLMIVFYIGSLLSLIFNSVSYILSYYCCTYFLFSILVWASLRLRTTVAVVNSSSSADIDELARKGQARRKSILRSEESIRDYEITSQPLSSRPFLAWLIRVSHFHRCV